MLKPYYEQDGIVIYHGDCREVLPSLGRFDLLLTDPPYGIGTWNDRSQSHGTRFTSDAFKWDVKPEGDLFVMMLSHSHRAIVFGFNHFSGSLCPTKKVLVWDKQFTDLHFNDCELAWTRGIGDACRIFRLSPAKAERKDHPTQKPEALILWCITQSGPVASVLDPFMGSGTTLVVAKRLGKRATGIELEEKYCEIAAKRLAQGALPMEFSA